MNNLYSNIQCPHCGANPQTDSITTGCKLSTESTAPKALASLCIHLQKLQQHLQNQDQDWFNFGHVRISIPDYCNGCENILFISTTGTLITRKIITNTTNNPIGLEETHLCHSCNEEFRFTMSIPVFTL
jgi:hypothetical protein